MSYVELHACSAFSFLRGGSFPEQLAETAAELEMPAMALLDHNGVYGAQRFSVAAREHKVRPIVGCELSIDDGSVLPVLVENRDRLQKFVRTADPGASAQRERQMRGAMERVVAICERAGRAVQCLVRKLLGRLRQTQNLSQRFTNGAAGTPLHGRAG